VAATLPSPDEVREIVRAELETAKREILAAVAAITGERLLSVPEAADEYAVSPRTIQRWIRTGDLPVQGMGRVRRVRRGDLDRLTGRA